MSFNPMMVSQSVVPASPQERSSSCSDFEKIRRLTEERTESPTRRYKKVIQESKKFSDLRMQPLKQKDEPYQENVPTCCERIWAIVEANMEYLGRHPLSSPGEGCYTSHYSINFVFSR